MDKQTAENLDGLMCDMSSFQAEMTDRIVGANDIETLIECEEKLNERAKYLEPGTNQALRNCLEIQHLKNNKEK